jgi:glycosyltransferase involved in cell wall biosynthesis
MKVLHISESYEGGVATAVANYVDTTTGAGADDGSRIEHFLLCNTRSGKLDRGNLERFSTVFDLPKSHFDAIKTVRAVVDKLQPDVIHCHSSFGGGYGRLGARHFPGLIVYTPHCYAFERRDIGMMKRRMFYLMEKVLSRYTDVVVAVSERERELARKIGGRKGFRAVFVPNFSALPVRRGGKRRDVVIGLGRLAPQKDPLAFARVATLVDAEFVWVGDGEEKYLIALREAGVKVTGWKTQTEVAKLLASAKVYLHTAQWEGFPMTILDAERSGLAIAVRDAPYLTGMPRVGRGRTADRLAAVVGELMSAGDAWEQNREAWREALAENNAQVAGEVLVGVYKSGICTG